MENVYPCSMPHLPTQSWNANEKFLSLLNAALHSQSWNASEKFLSLLNAAFAYTILEC